MGVLRAYGSADNLKGLAQTLQAWAIRPFVNLALSKNTTDVALAVDAMELACQTPKPAIVAIGSGDADFLPLVVRLRERGIRVICVSERSKMAAEAAHAYDSVLQIRQVHYGKKRLLNGVFGRGDGVKKLPTIWGGGLGTFCLSRNLNTRR